jgi:hypothetical protein
MRLIISLQAGRFFACGFNLGRRRLSIALACLEISFRIRRENENPGRYRRRPHGPRHTEAPAELARIFFEGVSWKQWERHQLTCEQCFTRPAFPCRAGEVLLETAGKEAAAALHAIYLARKEEEKN